MRFPLPHAAGRVRTAAKFARVLPALALAGALTLGGAGRAAAQEFLANQIENLISSDTLKVEITGLSGALSGNLRVESVTASDPGGVFLTARDLALDWSPLALVRKRVTVEALTAGQIVLERLPQTAPADPNAEAGSSGLPNITADIGRIAVDEFVLGEAIAGTRARLTANARLVLDNDPTKLEAAASIKRLDKPGQIEANLAFAPADNRLDIKVEAGEPAGGLVATLLKLPGAPPVNLTVSGSGALSDFMANGSLVVGGEPAANLTARVNDTAEGRQVAASLGVAAERFAPEAYAPYLKGGANLDVQLVLRGDGVIAIRQAELGSDSVSITASGTLDRAGAGNALDVAVTGRNGAAVPLRFGTGEGATAIDVAALKGRLAGGFGAADIDLTVSLPAAGYGPYAARGLEAKAAARGFNIPALAGPLRIEAAAQSVAAPEGVAAQLLAGPVTIVADGALDANGITLASSRIATDGAEAEISGTAALSFSTFDLRLAGDFKTLALSAAAVPVAGDRIAISGGVSRAADGALAVKGLAVRGRGLAVDGSATLAGGAVAADVKGSVDVPAGTEAGFAGKADFALKADGPLAGPDIDLSLTGEALTVAGRALTGLKLAARGDFVSAAPSGSVDLAGTLDGAPLSGSARVAADGEGRRRISGLRIQQGPNTIAGDITLTEAFVPVGTLSLAVPDIAPLAALALQEVTGDLAGTVGLSLDAGTLPVADVKLASARLAVAGTALSRADIALRIEDYLARPFVAGRISAEAVTAGGVRIAGLGVDLERRGEATHLAAAATANGVPVTLQGEAALGAGEATLRLETLTAAIPGAAVALRRPATIRIRNGVTSLDALALGAGSGSIALKGSAGDALDLALDLADVPAAVANPFVADLEAAGTISGTASVSGAAADPAARFDIRALGVETSQTRAARIPAVQAALAGTYGGGTLELRTAEVDLGGGSLAATGRVGKSLDLSLALDRIPVSLANGFVAGLDASGSVSGSAKASGTLADPAAVFQLKGDGITAAAVAAGGVPPVVFDAAGRFADGTLTLDRLRADVGTGSLTASGTAGRTLDLKLALADIPVGLANGFVPGLNASGTLNGRASATGSLAQPSAVFDLTGSGITAREIAAGGIPPLELRLAGSLADGTARLETAVATVGKASLRASGSVGRRLDLAVALNAVPVGLVNGFVPGLKASGTISGDGEATGTLADPAARFRLAGTGITAEQIAASGIRPITLDLAGRYGAGTATIETARARIGDGSLSASGSIGRALDLKVVADKLPAGLANGFVPSLKAAGSVSGTAAATGSLADPEAVFDIAARGLSTAATRAARTPAINAVAKGRYAGQTLRIETARVDVGGGAVTIAGTAGTTLALDVTIARLPASLASAAAAGIDPAGTINGTVKATGAATDPTVVYDIDVAGFSLKQTRDAGVGPLGIGAEGRFAGKVLTLDAALSGNGLAFKAGGSVNVAGTPRLDLSLNGTVPLALGNRILAEGGRSAKGTATVNVRVTGAATAPSVDGTVSTAGASFVDTGANLAVNGISTVIALRGQTATIQSFSARLAGGGTIAVGGTLGLAGGFPADISVKVANGRYNDGELLAATVNADLTLTGPLAAGPRLAGTVDAAKVDVLVPEKLPTSLSRIDVKHRNASRAVIRQQNEIAPKGSGGGSGGVGLTLDVALNAPSRVFVRGRGLDIELGGRIAVRGPASAPAINGAFELRRGRFTILSNRLDFQRGRLSFTGDLLPTLDLLATSEAGDVTVSVAVTGPANDPSFNFSSQPALPQDEVLARLIFGQGTANLSPLQIAQLAEAAATLAGAGGSTGLLENLRSQLGVDDLDIKTMADGQTSVGVGKYLNDKTYLGVDSTGRVAIDLDIGKGLKARGAVSATGGGEVGLFYENEY